MKTIILSDTWNHTFSSNTKTPKTTILEQMNINLPYCLLQSISADSLLRLASGEQKYMFVRQQKEVHSYWYHLVLLGETEDSVTHTLFSTQKNIRG